MARCIVIIGEKKVEHVTSVYMNCPRCGERIPTGILFLSHHSERCRVPLIHNIFSPCPKCGNYCELSGEKECFDKTLFKGHAA